MAGLFTLTWFAGSAPTPAAAPPGPPLDEKTPDALRPELVRFLSPTLAATPPGMVWLPAGTFKMGTSDKEVFPDAAPVHDVELDGFWIDISEVTNLQFARFVKATNYVTVAERPLDPKDFPNVPREDLKPGSIVFKLSPGAEDVHNVHGRWQYIPGACWKHPEGPGSDLKGRENHPVVHIAYEDAAAYAKWAGKRLPTEAEWEYAARGGLVQKPFVWGDELTPNNKWMANIWQGRFPTRNTAQDGYVRTAPVASYAANGFGLYDMAGNVWEWCSDFYRPDYYANSPKKNPQGPDSSHDPAEPNVAKRVQRGGSFMCADDYCVRYRPAGRGKGELNSSHSHVGFRCVMSVK
jgi:formylglycine-generating enzyme required for sulfatase activity